MSTKAEYKDTPNLDEIIYKKDTQSIFSADRRHM